MEKRKNPAVDPERQRLMFVLIGLVISLSIGLLAFEWRTFETRISQIASDLPDEEIEEKIIDIQLSTPPPPPPPPPSMAEVVEIVENDVVIENEIKVENTQVDENTEVKHSDFTGTYNDEPVEDNTVYDPNALQDTPVFPGCEDAKTTEDRNQCFQEKIISYINKNFKYPEDAREMGYQGRVIVQFVIEKDGSVNGATVVKGVYASLDKEALRVINSLPSIKPAKQAGRPVRVRYNVPIVLRIQ